MSLDILTINYNDSDADRLFEESLKNTGFAGWFTAVFFPSPPASVNTSVNASELIL